MAAVGKRHSMSVEGLQQDLSNDLRLISNEAKKKHPDVREAAERCLMHLRKVSNDRRTFNEALRSSDQLVPSLLYCCDCKQPRVVELALGSLQRLVKHNLLPKDAAESVIGMLRNLLVAGVEEVRVVQTLLLLVSVPDVVSGRVLGKAFLLAVALRESRNPTLSHTASAAVSQMVSSAFDRAGNSISDTTLPAPQPIVDAFSLFQDICLVTNGDRAMWLPQTPKLGRLLGLELIESSLRNYAPLFLMRPEFGGLVKERVCPLVIKLFSPTTKTKDLSGIIPPPSADKPHFAVFVRLMRIVSVLVSQFFSTLVTECEIFLTLLVKFMEAEKPLWQQVLAVEALNLLVRDEALVGGFCQHYDMEEHSSRILAELVEALGGFIQGCFTCLPAQSQQGAGPGSEEECPAYYTVRNVAVPVYHLPPSVSTKPLMMEAVDKSEAAPTHEGYPLAVAVDALMNLINSIVRLSGGGSAPSSPTTPPSAEKGALREVLLHSSWSGMLAALALLLDACGDEMLRENILKAHLSFIHLCGRCGLTEPRDAFLTSLCKAALPGHYAMALVTGPAMTATPVMPAPDSPTADRGFTYVFGDSSAKTRDRQGQLGRVGMAWDGTHYHQPQVSTEGEGGVKMRFPKSASSAHSGVSSGEAVELTAKRLQCIRSLVNLAQCYAEDLGRGWRILLQTLHHLTHVLGLQPQSNGALRPVRTLDTSSMALPASPGKKSALGMLCDLLSNLFDSSQHFSAPALCELIEALEQVSKDSEDSTRTAGSLCMFSEAKLLEVTLANFPRLELIWDKVIGHFMRSTESANTDIRMYCCNAVVMVTKVGLSGVHGNEPSQTKRFLQLLSGLQRSSFEDVHVCLLSGLTDLLHSCGERVGSSWNEVLGVICDVANSTSEQLVRRGFQALQLVISDYLPALPTSEVPLCIVVVTKFALQQVDINISLTAVGLLWTVADHLFHSKVAVATTGHKASNKMPPLPSDVVTKIPNVAAPRILSPFLKSFQSPTPELANRLWLLLFASLSDLCADPRAAVRKSASQTLFSTVTAHGTLLEDRSWGVVLWMVLFPLLELVQERTQSASTLDLHASFLIHHTRNTAQKQWAESQVLTLSGVSRLFQSRWRLLSSLEAFGRMWSKYCSVLAAYAQSPYEEVLLAVLKSIRDLLMVRLEEGGAEDPAVWAKLWEVWRGLATPTGLSGGSGGSHSPQNVLVEYLLVFLPLSAQLRGSWKQSHVEELRRTIMAALVVPVPKDTSPFLCPSPSSDALSALQHVCLLCLASLYCDPATGHQLAQVDSVERGLHKPLTLEQVRESFPVSDQGEVRGVVMETLLELIQLATGVVPVVSSCYHFGPFVKSALVHAVHLLESCDCHVTSSQALTNFLKVLEPVLCTRRWLHEVPVWKDCHTVLVGLIRWAGQHSPGVAEGAWQQLMSTLHGYLTASESDSHTTAAEVERMDVELVQTIQTHLVPVVAKEEPVGMVQELSEILSQGSTHIVRDPLKSGADEDWFRESFSRHCFDALLQLSVATTRSGGASSSAAVLGHWVNHCRESLEVFSREEAVSRGVPLPRARVTDVLTTLHSVVSLVIALQERQDRVPEVWAQVCKLYPTLVTCVSCDSREVRDALKATLLQFTFIIDAFTQK